MPSKTVPCTRDQLLNPPEQLGQNSKSTSSSFVVAVTRAADDPSPTFQRRAVRSLNPFYRGSPGLEPGLHRRSDQSERAPRPTALPTAWQVPGLQHGKQVEKEARGVTKREVLELHRRT